MLVIIWGISVHIKFAWKYLFRCFPLVLRIAAKPPSDFHNAARWAHLNPLDTMQLVVVQLQFYEWTHHLIGDLPPLSSMTNFSQRTGGNDEGKWIYHQPLASAGFREFLTSDITSQKRLFSTSLELISSMSSPLIWGRPKLGHTIHLKFKYTVFDGEDPLFPLMN